MMDVEVLIRTMMECSKKIRRQLGPGYLESVYKNSMLIELQKNGLAYEVDYLTATGIDHGLLINFGSEELQFKRKFRIYRKRFS